MIVENGVLVGKKDNLFLVAGAHNVMDLFKDKKNISEESIKNFFFNIKERQKYCKERNIYYNNIVFPDKIYVDREFHDIKVDSVFNSKYKSSSWYSDDLCNLYLGDGLAKKESMFYKTDTHLSLEGNINAVGMILKGLFSADQIDNYKKYVYKDSFIDDLFSGDLGGKFDPNKTEKTKVFRYHRKNIKICDNGISNGNDGIIVLCENRNSISKQTLLIYGDSFFRALLPHFLFFYATVVFCRTKYFHYEDVDKFNPDVIFSGMAERYLSYVNIDSNRPNFFTYPYLKNKSIEPTKDFTEMFTKIYNNKERKIKKLIILGSQRSGTSILSSVIGELKDCKHFAETNVAINSDDRKEGGQTIRLKKLEEVGEIFKNINNKKLIVFKPLVESQNTEELLDFFEDSIAFWTYRNYRDVIASNLKKWDKPTAKIYFGPIINKSSLNWRSENLTDKCYDIFNTFYDPEMTSADATALFWLLRNQLFFEQKLENNKNVSLINYESLVNDGNYLQAKLDRHKIDIVVKQEEHKFNKKSLKKGSEIILSKLIIDACEEMYARLKHTEFLMEK